jgi:hypothetical protein
MSQNLTALENFLVVLAIFLSFKKQMTLSMLALAFAAYLGIYPVMFIAPLAIIMNPREKITQIILCTLSFTLNLVVFLYLSYLQSGSWSFLSACYGFMQVSLFILTK